MSTKFFTFLSFLLLSICLPSYSSMAKDTTSQKILDELNLSRSDVRIYKKIFSNIRNAKFKIADKQIKNLDNKLLLGHALAEKYLSAKYKSTPQELSLWLEKYSDHPQKNRIYKLAIRKNALNLPDKTKEKKSIETFSVYNWAYDNFHKLTLSNRIFLDKQIKKFRRSIRLGKTKQARIILENPKVKKLLPKKYYSILALTLATKYLTDGYSHLALQWGEISAQKNSNASAFWTAGIAAWKLKHYKTAASQFKKVSSVSNNDEWISSAGDFWTARAYKKQKNIIQTQKWLKKAAAYKRTFYGILAAYMLGEKPDYNWSKISYFNDFKTQKNLDFLLENIYLKRILGLIFTDQEELARSELKNALNIINESQKEAILYLADYYNMHSISMLLSQELCDDNESRSYDHSFYPLPDWKPQSGWKLDSALIWALSRQESSFRPYVISPVGACGLMQLLPSTAAYISGNKQLRRNRQKLFEIQYNLELGQNYVKYLLEKPFINGNLIYMLTAYNAGPGNLSKWLKKIKDNNDPLLYMEIIPSRETRIYIERVIANYWIYQIRLDKPTPTLELLSKNKWPIIVQSER